MGGKVSDTDEMSPAIKAADEHELELLAERLVPLASPLRLRLLRYLTRPHYLEEIATYLSLTRQAARKHLEQLVEIGVLDRQPGVRSTGAVTEYVVNAQSLFLLYDEFEKLASLRRDDASDVLSRTVPRGLDAVALARREGPSLTIVRGLDYGRRVRMPAQPGAAWIIGREATCAIGLAYDAFASNRHAEIRFEDRAFRLRDLRSTNGTTHNWLAMPRGGEIALAHGDTIGVGKSLFLFWDPR